MEQVIEGTPLIWNRLRRLMHVERLLFMIIVSTSQPQTQPQTQPIIIFLIHFFFPSLWFWGVGKRGTKWGVTLLAE